MAVSLKGCSITLLVLAAACIQLYDAQFVPGARCVCEGTIKFTSEKIVDFQVIERSPNCNRVELIVTLEEDRAMRCLNTEGKLAKAFLQCWNKINKDTSQKMKCLNRRKKMDEN